MTSGKDIRDTVIRCGYQYVFEGYILLKILRMILGTQLNETDFIISVVLVKNLPATPNNTFF